MSVATLAMSHSPLMHHIDENGETKRWLNGIFAELREFVSGYDPQLVITFGPDHYNGFFYDTMPMACVGLTGFGLGDYDTATGDASVPTERAESLARHILNAGVDVAISRRMGMDHGAVQPLEILFGGIDNLPIIPIFVNGVAAPFSPMHRIRALGQAVGSWAKAQDERVLFIASGGLSHDPPVPQWATASEEVRATLLDGRNPTPEARNARERRVIETGRAFARGEANIRDLNPEWDQKFLDACASGDLAYFDALRVDEMTRDAGNSSHEVRTWVAAFSALSQAGPYAPEIRHYKPIREMIAGFGVLTARPTNDHHTSQEGVHS